MGHFCKFNQVGVWSFIIAKSELESKSACLFLSILIGRGRALVAFKPVKMA